MKLFQAKSSDFYKDKAEESRMKLTPPHSDTSIYGTWWYAWGINFRSSKRPPGNMTVSKGFPCRYDAETAGSSLKGLDAPPVITWIKSGDKPLNPRQAAEFIYRKEIQHMPTAEAKTQAGKKSSPLKRLFRR